MVVAGRVEALAFLVQPGRVELGVEDSLFAVERPRDHVSRHRFDDRRPAKRRISVRAPQPGIFVPRGEL